MCTTNTPAAANFPGKPVKRGAANKEAVVVVREQKGGRFHTHTPTTKTHPWVAAAKQEAWGGGMAGSQAWEQSQTAPAIMTANHNSSSRENETNG
uniref:Uncharacterized protein n=1 Tax=Ditylenchus dipsaci TaxID=166011 RepID=A0A915CM77_9BILA